MTDSSNSPAIASVEDIAQAFRDAVCGPDHIGSPEVIWSDCGSRIMLHVGTLQVRTGDGAVVVAVDTESGEFGVAPLIVRFVFGTDGGPASLVAATDAEALGHPQVAARWGGLFRDVVWAEIARQVAVRSAGRPPVGLRIGPGGMELTVAEPHSAVDLAREHVDDLVARGLREPVREPA